METLNMFAQAAADGEASGGLVIDALIVALVPFIVGFVKTSVWPRIPKTFVMLAAGLVGIGLDYLAAVAIDNHTASVAMGALLGASGSWLKMFLKNGAVDLKLAANKSRSPGS